MISLPNVTAFLAMVSHTEGTDRAPDPYRVCFGFEHTIQAFDDHPYASGEWPGARYGVLNMLSTAAGRYQINIATWRVIKARLGLIDFSPQSQDDAAIELIKQRDALHLVLSGDISGAIAACATLWASLPGSLSGQPQATLEAALDTFSAAGGSLA